jgi:putative peptidoglycan lipid II flippase
LTDDLKRLLIIAGPALVTGGVVQINTLISRQVASWSDGAIAWLNFADRLYQLPLGVVGIAIGVVLLPELSRRVRAEDVAGQQESYSRATEFCLLLTLPATVAFLVIPLPLIQVLFEGGEFTTDDTASTALALMIYALGLPSFVLAKVMQPLFFAREDTKTPLWFALVSLLINAAVAFGLWSTLGWVAAALGTTLASWSMVLLLWLGVRRMGQVGRVDARTKRRSWAILASSLMMGVVLWALNLVLGPSFDGPFAALSLLALVLAGMGSYLGFAILTGATMLSDLKGALRRQR